MLLGGETLDGKSLESKVFQPVQPSRQYHSVVEQIRSAIFSGVYKPGDRLPPERELAQLLGVSRVAVREALRVLQHAGLVEVRPGHGGGSFIRDASFEPVSEGFLTQLQLDVFSYDDLFEAKRSLEPVITAVAARKATPADIEALRENVAAMRGAADDDLPGLSYEFNRLLGMATHNNFLAQIMIIIPELLRHIGFQEFPGTFWQQVLAEHEAIVQAVAAHDEDLARKLMEAHVENVWVHHRG